MIADRVPAGEVTVRVFDRGAEPACIGNGRRSGPWRRYEAELEGYEAVRELGRSPWEAVHRLVSMHRGLLERRWSGMSVPRLVPDAVISLGEWEICETDERLELACVVMTPPGWSPRGAEPLDIVRPELPEELRELVRFVLAVWCEARGLGA